MNLEYSPLRQFALRVACIHPDDRNWLREQLEASDRQALDLLLQEIDELGLAKDASVLSSVLSQSAPAAFLATDSIMPEDVALHELVAKAPHPFWAALILQDCDSGQRSKVVSALSGAGMVRRWDQSLMDIDAPPALLAAVRAHIMGRVGHVDA